MFITIKFISNVTVMRSKMLVLLGTLCLVTSCMSKDEASTQKYPLPLPRGDLPVEPVQAASKPEVNQDDVLWRMLNPVNFVKWGVSLNHTRPKNPVRKEIITMMFETMLDQIVDSWETVSKPEESASVLESVKVVSDINVKKKKTATAKQPKIRRSQSKIEETENVQGESRPLSWWSSPDETAVIRFKNGNVYEGQISMKCMHGQGRFQWANGTVYLGQFKDNAINGRGCIQWKDDAWYEGEFIGNLRHGQGLYVDSREQRSYNGGWDCATKHGKGTMYYSKSFKNYYDGDWINNVRTGVGSREYCAESGYRGDWDHNIREGNGLMIWSNHDYYRGGWKNGVMNDFGVYIWDTHINNTMSLPATCVYRGQWEKGQRHGYGFLSRGMGLGAYYKGEFKNNKKHGAAQLVTNNGLILSGNKLFIEDNMGPITFDDRIHSPHNVPSTEKRQNISKLYKFDICDDNVGLGYHIEQALSNIDKEAGVRANIIDDFIKHNKIHFINHSPVKRKDIVIPEEPAEFDFYDFIEFEETSLWKAVKCYETELRNIYYKYATVCNTQDINFVPVLIRLYLSQFYYDCNVHKKGLTLVEIDQIFHKNPEWLSNSAHDPFEKIHYWQFIHSLIAVSSRLYANRQLPEVKPDTIVASAFRNFMETDVLPGVMEQKGKLVNGFASYIPLQSLYALYCSLGEPHTVRTFLRAVRRSPHRIDHPQPPLVDVPDNILTRGKNLYTFGDRMKFIASEKFIPIDETESDIKERKGLKLFNFGNLSSKSIIKIFAKIFPQLCGKDKILDLDVEITFYEFFEGFVQCAEESIRVQDEEMLWRMDFLLEQSAPLEKKTK